MENDVQVFKVLKNFVHGEANWTFRRSLMTTLNILAKSYIRYVYLAILFNNENISQRLRGMQNFRKRPVTLVHKD